jgi:hypothetical protein
MLSSTIGLQVSFYMYSCDVGRLNDGRGFSRRACRCFAEIIFNLCALVLLDAWCLVLFPWALLLGILLVFGGRGDYWEFW